MNESAEVAAYRAALKAYVESRQAASLAHEASRQADVARDVAGSRVSEAREAIMAAAAGGLDEQVWHWQSKRPERPWWKRLIDPDPER